jgi:hypothetical protein
MPDLKGAAATVLGTSALMAFGVLVVVLLGHVSDTEQQWTRLVYLFGAVEAIAFSAAGYFFGKEVHRERAEKAETRELEAEGRAQSAQAREAQAGRLQATAETNLRALTQVIETRVEVPGTAAKSMAALGGSERDRGPEAVRDQEDRAGDLEWRQLAAFARKLSANS